MNRHAVTSSFFITSVMWYATERRKGVNSLTLLLFESIGTKTDS